MNLLLLLLSIYSIFIYCYGSASPLDTKDDFLQPHEKNVKGAPKFIQQPEPVYYVGKGKPVTITCIAEPVNHVNMVCAEKKYSYMGKQVSESGLTVEKFDSQGKPDPNGNRWKFSYTINQKQVTDWYSDFKCYCEVWNLIMVLDKNKRIHSSKTFVYDTYFNKNFRQIPESKTILEGDKLELLCQPPEAKPPAEISWKRNGKMISDLNSKSQNSVNSPTKINKFTIPNINLADSGNYSCIAKSLDVTRISTAQITVIKAGEWSNWSKWDKKCPSYCYQKSTEDCSPECSSHKQTRTRHCKTSDNSKQPITRCRGIKENTRECNYYCSYDMWVVWNDWSPCNGNPCQKRRTGRCLFPDKCGEPNKEAFTQVINCTGSKLCTNGVFMKPDLVNNQQKPEGNKSRLRYMDSQGLYLVLSIAVVVFVLVVIVIVFLVNKNIIRFCPNGSFRFSSSSNGITLFHPDKNLKKEFSNLSTAKSVNVIDINGNSTINGGAPNSALLPQHQVQPGLYRSTMLYPTQNTTSMPFLAAPHHQSVDALTSNQAGTIGVYTDVTLPMNNSGLITIANNNGEMPSVGYYSATPLNNAQPNNQNNGPSMIRPSYSDSKVASVLNPNFKNHHLTNTMITPNYNQHLHYPMTSPLIPPPPPPPLMNSHLPHHNYHQHSQMNTLPVLPATSLSAASRPSSEHYQELGTTTDHTTDDDDDEDNHGASRNCDDCDEVRHSHSLSSVSGPGINLQKQHFNNNNNNNANIKSLINQVTELYPSEQISWASLSNSPFSSIRLSVPHQDITLTCPLKAVAVDKSEVIYLMTSSNEQDLPALNENETLLSPIIVCGPSSLVVNKPFILSIPHCAIASTTSSNPNFTSSRSHNTSNSNNNTSTHTNTTSTSLSSGNSSIASSGIVTNSDISSGSSNYSNWYITVLTSYSLLTQKPYWQKFVDVPISSFLNDNNPMHNNNSYSNPPGYAHLLKDRLLLMTTQLQRYCIVGCTNKQSTSNGRGANPVNNGAIKSMRVVAYSTGLITHNNDMNNLRYNHHHSISSSSSSEIVVRVYIIPDCQEALSRVHSNETERLGAKLVAMRKLPEYGENNNVNISENNSDTANNKENSCQFPFQDDSGNVNITVSDLPNDWQASVTNKTQEIPFQSVWHSSNLHCSFTFLKRAVPSHHNATNSSHSSSISSASTTGPNPLPISATTLLQQQYNSANSMWSCSLCIQQANCAQYKVNVTLFSQHHPPPHLLPTQQSMSKGPLFGTPCFVDDCYTSGSKKTSSSSMTNSHIKEVIAFRIPEQTKFKLALLLDLQSPHENDWRLLAHFLRVKRSLSFFSNKPSPTEALLDLLEEIVSETTQTNQNKINHQMHQSNVISQLINLFRSKGRIDCIAVLEAGLMETPPQ